ncbi:MAG: glutaminyl-peptide cyclotransferase [Spongiibacteraceae bacterium]
MAQFHQFIPRLILLFALWQTAWAEESSGVQASQSHVAELPYQLIARYPHDTTLFTQGLELYRGKLYESSGLYGKSKLLSRHFPPRADKQLSGVMLPERMFAEGLSFYRDRLYILSWRAQQGLILDPHHFGILGSFRYPGQGWGLCFADTLGSDGLFVMSNGSDVLQLFEPQHKMRPHSSVHARNGSQALQNINELECHGNYLVANQWHQKHLLVIDLKSGQLLARVDLSDLHPTSASAEAVLNGIAYDASSDSWLITGKYWPEIFRIRFQLPGQARESTNIEPSGLKPAPTLGVTANKE